MLPTAVKSKIISLKSPNVWGLSHPIPPLIFWLQECNANLSCPVTHPLLSPGSHWTSQRDHRGKDLTANGAPASTEIWLCLFCFSEEMEYVENQKITSPNQQTSDYSPATAQAATEATVRPWRLALPKSNGAEYTFQLFLYFLFGWLVPADIAALKGNSLRNKQKFSWLATL